jgi:hypothetical protein
VCARQSAAFARVAALAPRLELDAPLVERLGDGLARVTLTVRNVGRGQSFSTQATIKNLSGGALLLHDARFAIDNMAPGEERRVAFTFDVSQSFRESDVRIELALEDEDLREVESQKITLPVAREAGAVSPATGASTFTAETELRESPVMTARVVVGHEYGKPDVVPRAPN